MTLEPVNGHVDQEIEVNFLPQQAADLAPDAGDPSMGAQSGDTEIIAGGLLDLGSVIAEYLSLAIAPTRGNLGPGLTSRGTAAPRWLTRRAGARFLRSAN